MLFPHQLFVSLFSFKLPRTELASMPRTIFAGSCTTWADKDILAPQSSHKSLHWIITFNSVQSETNSPRSWLLAENTLLSNMHLITVLLSQIFSMISTDVPFFYPIAMNIMSRCSLHLPLFCANNPNKNLLAHALNLSKS